MNEPRRDTQKAALLLSGLETKTIDAVLSRLDSETARTLLRELRTLPVVSETEKKNVAEEFIQTLSVKKQRLPRDTDSSIPLSGTYRRPFSSSGV